MEATQPGTIWDKQAFKEERRDEQGRFIALLDKDWLDLYWLDIARAAGQLEDFFIYETVGDFLGKVEKGQYQTWFVGDKTSIELVFFSSIVVVGMHRVLVCTGVFGVNWEKYRDLVLSSLDRVAAGLDCDTIEIPAGRGGWARELKKSGFRERYVTLTKEVNKTVN